MSVRVIAITKPVVDGLSTASELVAYAARVSNPDNQLNKLTFDKLIAYLQKHKHWSPFEMASATVEIETTRDIARQMLRHRSFSFQEFSQRYAAVNAFDLRTARRQDDKNRQNSINDLKTEDQAWWIEEQQYLISRIKMTYQEALRRGIAKECARAILPEGNTSTVMYMAGTFRSWLHYLAERTGEGTQLEHQQIARLIQNNLALEEKLFGELV